MFKINLLPKVVKRKEVIRLPFLGILFFIILFIVLLGALTLYRNILIEVRNLRNENISLEQQISVIKDRIRELQKIDEMKKQYSERLKLLDEISQKEISWLSIFESLNRNTPRNLWLKNFAMEDLNLNLEGFALSYNDIAVFLAQMESLGMWENIKLAFASRVGNPPYDSINFQLSAQYKRVEE
ncbi:MAG: PilN domain-containing protein [Dictyoglomus sp.]|nr:PilN domain-containing protein [Dictyoglomus sp.]MCX7941801.1 PilN domain-containing protein [Dictyoglomaceae bacterium]MDW8188096.1 PilN domain-containing protein [Dictyoglomus sp.]